MLKDKDKLHFETLNEYLIDSYIASVLEKPYRGKTYTYAQQSQIQTIASQFEHIDRFHDTIDNDIVKRFRSRVADWEKGMQDLIGKSETEKYLKSEHSWHPYKSYHAWAFTSEDGVRCKYGNCNFSNKDYWTYENVNNSLKNSIKQADESQVSFLNKISVKDIYDKSLSLKDWIIKYGKVLESYMKSYILTKLYDLSCTYSNVDSVMESYIKSIKDNPIEKINSNEKLELNSNSIKNSGHIKIGYRPDFLKTPILYGRERVIILANGEKHKGQYAIVELENILASHNENSFESTPDYPLNVRGENINDRNYAEDKNAQLKVKQVAQNFEPEITVSTGVTPAGLPIITVDGVVVSGNNRTMSVKLAKDSFKEKYENYLKVLQGEITSFGFDIGVGISLVMRDRISLPGSSYNNPLSVKFKTPFLVRIDYDFQEYTTSEMNKYNKDTKKTERPIDKAIRLSSMLLDNERILNSIVSIIDKFDNLSEIYASKNATQSIIKIMIDGGIIIKNELNEIITENGLLNTSGKDLIVNLLLSSIMDKNTILASDIDGVKSFKDKIIIALPSIISNLKYKDGNIKQYINDAVMLEAEIRSQGLTVIDHIRSIDMFGDKKAYDKKAYIINDILKQSKFGLKKLLESYNIALENNQGESLFGESLTPEDIFKTIFESKADEAIIKAIQNYKNDGQKEDLNIANARARAVEIINARKRADEILKNHLKKNK